MLIQRAPRAVNGLKIATLQWREKEMRARLASLSGQEAADALARLQEIRAVISSLARYLGERIVLPR